jgi:hypothetical protein
LLRAAPAHVTPRLEPMPQCSESPLYDRNSTAIHIPQSEIAAHTLMHLSNSRYAFFFRNMLLFNPRVAGIPGMWYSVISRENQIFSFTGYPARPDTLFAK